ncbi:hypothetical protein [Dactylosporangium cerinum]
MDVDERVRQAFAVGQPLNLGGADVPATLLMELLTGELPTRRAALRLHEARVTGKLVLSFAEVTCPLLVQESEFLEPPDLYWARLAFTGFRNTRLPGLHAAGVTVAGHLRLSGIRSTGVINLRGAKIAGGLLLDRAHLLRPGGTALLAERLELSGDLVAEHGFRAEGTLRLFQATVTGGIHLNDATVIAPPAAPDAPPETFEHLGDGETLTPRPGAALGVDLDSATVQGGVFGRRATVHGEVSLRNSTIGGVATFTGATLSNPGAVAMRLDRADVAGGVHLLGGCSVEGELRLVGTRVGRILRLTGATLANPGGHALRADNCSVDGPVDCREGFTATGEVSLLEARVAGPVFFEGAHLDNPDGTSLRATGIVTGSLLHCCDGFTATGRVTMRAARIGGRLCFHDAHLQGVWCTGAEAVELDLRFAEPPAGRLDLRYLKVALLRDDAATWPADVRLDGLTYQTLIPLLEPPQRLQWLARTPTASRRSPTSSSPPSTGSWATTRTPAPSCSPSSAAAGRPGRGGRGRGTGCRTSPSATGTAPNAPPCGCSPCWSWAPRCSPCGGRRRSIPVSRPSCTRSSTPWTCSCRSSISVRSPPTARPAPGSGSRSCSSPPAGPSPPPSPPASRGS